MKKIVKFKEDDIIPEGAKFLYTETESKLLGSYEKLVSSGLIFSTYQTIHKVKTTRYFYYEVEEN